MNMISHEPYGISCKTFSRIFYINSLHRSSRVERPWPGGEKRRGGRASHHEELCSAWGVAPSVCDHRVLPERDGVSERCHSSESAMDACSDTPAWARRAERAADGRVVDG